MNQGFTSMSSSSTLDAEKLFGSRCCSVEGNLKCSTNYPKMLFLRGVYPISKTWDPTNTTVYSRLISRCNLVIFLKVVLFSIDCYPSVFLIITVVTIDNHWFVVATHNSVAVHVTTHCSVTYHCFVSTFRYGWPP